MQKQVLKKEEVKEDPQEEVAEASTQKEEVKEDPQEEVAINDELTE